MILFDYRYFLRHNISSEVGLSHLSKNTHLICAIVTTASHSNISRTKRSKAKPRTITILGVLSIVYGIHILQIYFRQNCVEYLQYKSLFQFIYSLISCKIIEHNLIHISWWIFDLSMYSNLISRLFGTACDDT